ncbi:MAG: DUF559 domain-containing protein [Solirubrobacteraceae bacterium]
MTNDASEWGVVARARLIADGVSVAAIDSALRRGELRLVHRGVYAVGPGPLRDEGVWLAAVLACGPGAVLSHTAAARLWGMRTPRGDASLHVTLAAGQARPRGVVVHRTRHLSAADVTIERGIRVTTPARTVIDCAGTLTYQELRVLADHGVRLDAAAIRRAQRLVVEVDGGAFHAPKPAREADYERDAALVAAGWRVVRYTYDQVFHEPDAVAARLDALLRGRP